MGVPKKLTGMLDARAAQIKSDLDEARALREEAKTILASYERKQKEVAEQTDRIIATAKEEAMAAAEQAKADLKAAIARRLAGAEEQIASAEAAAVQASARTRGRGGHCGGRRCAGQADRRRRRPRRRSTMRLTQVDAKLH